MIALYIDWSNKTNGACALKRWSSSTTLTCRHWLVDILRCTLCNPMRPCFTNRLYDCCSGGPSSPSPRDYATAVPTVMTLYFAMCFAILQTVVATAVAAVVALALDQEDPASPGGLCEFDDPILWYLHRLKVFFHDLRHRQVVCRGAPYCSERRGRALCA